MNKMEVVRWYDPDTCDTVKIAAQAYGIKIEAIEYTGAPDSADVCVYGPAEDVDRFVEDVNDGCADPFDLTCGMSDNEYQDWLVEELKKVGCFYIPKYVNEDEDEV